jgi:hypothetical protein
MSTKVLPALEQLAAEIGGEIKADGELYYGPPESQIFITAQDDGSFFLASQHPLYAIKNGKARHVRPGTKGDNVGWYYATVSPEQVRTALELALGVTDTEEHTVEFAYEHILRDYCAHNLPVVESGLSLYDKDGRSGIEFPAGGRFIDILAVDSSGGFVIFEFKLSRGHERVVGQLLRYIGWVRQHLATSGQRVRGIIIARHITEDLRLAATGQADIKLLEYELSITLKVT